MHVLHYKLHVCSSQYLYFTSRDAAANFSFGRASKRVRKRVSLGRERPDEKCKYWKGGNVVAIVNSGL